MNEEILLYYPLQVMSCYNATLLISGKATIFCKSSCTKLVVLVASLLFISYSPKLLKISVALFCDWIMYKCVKSVLCVLDKNRKLCKKNKKIIIIQITITDKNKIMARLV